MINNTYETEGKITIVPILALAYSGVTWLNMVASSHVDAFYLGAGQHVFKEGRRRPAEICLEHGSSCGLWPKFFRSYDPEQNFIVQLSKITGKRVFVINNPPLDLVRAEFVHPEIDIKTIRYIRNGQATLASAMRHTPQYIDSVYQAAVAWLYRGTLNFERRSSAMQGEKLTLRFEDCVQDPLAMLEKLSEFIDIRYTRDSLRYWEFDHHPTSGNTGVLDLYMRMRGHSGWDHKRRDFYDKAMEHAKQTEGLPLLDESWRNAFDDVDLAAYDFVAGAMYETYGYERPEVSHAARLEFVRRYNPPPTSAEAEQLFGPFVRFQSQKDVRAGAAVGAGWKRYLKASAEGFRWGKKT